MKWGWGGLQDFEIEIGRERWSLQDGLEEISLLWEETWLLDGLQ